MGKSTNWGCKAGKTGKGSFFGTVCSVGNKFGFIDCPPVEKQHNAQVFCPASMLSNMNVGDKVDFELSFNEKWQPQASFVSLKGKGGGKSKNGMSFGKGLDF